MLSEYIDSLAEKGIEFTFDERMHRKLLLRRLMVVRVVLVTFRNVIRKMLKIR